VPHIDVIELFENIKSIDVQVLKDILNKMRLS